jgi:hypothetical protein
MHLHVVHDGTILDENDDAYLWRCFPNFKSQIIAMND